jgi:class 3 adenylate cyclase
VVLANVRAELGDACRLEAMPPQRGKGIDGPVATWAVACPAGVEAVAGAAPIDSPVKP